MGTVLISSQIAFKLANLLLFPFLPSPPSLVVLSTEECSTVFGSVSHQSLLTTLVGIYSQWAADHYLVDARLHYDTHQSLLTTLVGIYHLLVVSAASASDYSLSDIFFLGVGTFSLRT